MVEPRSFLITNFTDEKKNLELITFGISVEKFLIHVGPRRTELHTISTAANAGNLFVVGHRNLGTGIVLLTGTHFYVFDDRVIAVRPANLGCIPLRTKHIKG